MSVTRPLLASHARLRWDRREGKYLLLSPERGLLLNSAGHAIVELCDGRHDPRTMAELLAARFGTKDVEGVLDSLGSFLERLASLGLLEVVPGEVGR